MPTIKGYVLVDCAVLLQCKRNKIVCNCGKSYKKDQGSTIAVLVFFIQSVIEFYIF